MTSDFENKTNEFDLDSFSTDIMEMDLESTYDDYILEDDELDEESKKIIDDVEDDLGGEIPADNYFLFSNLPINASATREEMGEIMERYRNATEKEDRDNAAIEMCGILHSYIIHLLNERFYTYMPKYRDDLIASSYLGVMKGLEKFDPKRGSATTWFKRYILHECNDFINTQISHSSAHYANAGKKVLACIAKKEAENIPYTVKDLYIETGVPVKTINSVLKIKEVKVTPISKETGDMDVPAEMGNPVSELETDETYNNLYECIQNTLSKKEQIVICYRFGLCGLEELTGKEISRRFGIPANQVSAIQKNAVHKLKKHMIKSDGEKMQEGSIPISELLFGDKSDEFIKKLKKSQWI